MATCAVRAQEITIDVHADQVLHKVSPHLTGACIEDVNHEIYGGIYSQMIFGESFQEPPPSPAVAGFKTYGGRWVGRRRRGADRRRRRAQTGQRPRRLQGWRRWASNCSSPIARDKTPG